LQGGRSWACGIVDGLAGPALSVGFGIRSIKAFIVASLIRDSSIVFTPLPTAVASAGWSVCVLFLAMLKTTHAVFERCP
jgi:hypothetical protein